MDQFILLCREFGATFTQYTTIHCFDLLVGMVLASIFEFPLLRRLRRS